MRSHCFRERERELGLKLNLMKLHNYIQRERERERGRDGGVIIINHKMTCFPNIAVRSYIVSQRETEETERDGGEIWD